MVTLSHIRFAIFDRQHYTNSQAAELRQLRALYTSYLAPAFGSDLPDAFALRTEGDEHYPRYTAQTLTPPPITAVPPSSALLRTSYKPFADILVSTLAAYEAGRSQRWFGKGHPNDPIRLLGIFLRNTCNQWLSQAHSNQINLQRVIALRQYLATLARESVFAQDGSGHDSMMMLLHNLTILLTQLEERMRHELNLQNTRENFRALKEGIGNVLSEAAHYLFYALAAKDRSQLPFALVNMQARVINKSLSRALETREGLLLKQWIHSPGVMRGFDFAEAKAAFVTRNPVSLFGAESPTPLLYEKGGANSAWCDFLEQIPTTEAQLDRTIKKLPSGICPLLLASKGLQDEENTLLSDAIQLHGLFKVLAGYQDYLHQCWELAGFAGEYCSYEQIAHAVAAILTELLHFNQALSARLEYFQDFLALKYTAALTAKAYLVWQANYRQAKAHQDSLLRMLTTSCSTLISLIAQSENMKPHQTWGPSLAEKAHLELKNVPVFLNQARQYIGLEPKAHYSGFEAPDSKTIASDLSAFSLAQELRQMSIDELLVILLPQKPSEVAWLGQVCAKTPRAVPWSGFYGSYQRYQYLHDHTRLEKIGQDLLYLQLSAPTPLTPKKSAFIDQLRAQLTAEQECIDDLRENLWWPFHATSIRFFAGLQSGIADKLRYLEQFSTTIPHKIEHGVSKQAPVLSSSLLPGSLLPATQNQNLGLEKRTVLASPAKLQALFLG